ncbi:hypothetical protein F66182_8455 [Fusarium sp. NRRL 66182]|nr:hypothetical protein F66182_8455 [Fusarium sp. NRRL 66182]
MHYQTQWHCFVSMLMLLTVTARSLPGHSKESILEVSIQDMLGPHPSILHSTTEYNKEYSLDYALHSSVETVSGNIDARGFGGVPFGCSSGDMCKCQPKRFKSLRWATKRTSRVSGFVHRISEPLCPPGTIGKSYTYSYSYQISVQAGPDIKGAFIPYLDKFGIRAGFSYTWGRAQTSTYTVQCNDPRNEHPCVEIFTPDIGIIHGTAYETVEVPGGKICSRGPDSHMEIHVPIVDSPDCMGKDATCGAQGVYDSCYYLGQKAIRACPRSNLGPIPKSHICPANLR